MLQLLLLPPPPRKALEQVRSLFALLVQKYKY
jgi:hypothetical protein